MKVQIFLSVELGRPITQWQSVQVIFVVLIVRIYLGLEVASVAESVDALNLEFSMCNRVRVRVSSEV